MFNRRLTKTVDGSMKLVWQNVLYQWIGLCFNIVTVLTIANLLRRVMAGTAEVGHVVLTVAVAAAAIAVRYLTTTASTNTGRKAAGLVKLDLREKILNKITTMGLSYRQDLSTAEVVQVAVEGIDQLEIYFSQYLPQFFYSLIAPVTLFVVLSFINMPSALLLLACVPLIPISIIAVQKFAKKLLSKYWDEYTQLGDGFLENIQGLTSLKVYGADSARHKEMNHQAERFRIVTMKVLSMQLNSIIIMDLIAFGGAALGVIISVLQFRQGNIDFAGALAIILLAAEFFIPLRLLGSFFHIAMNGMAASEKIFKLLDMPENTTEKTAVPLHTDSIELENISFAYEAGRPVLNDVSLQLEKGITSIVGESGCGKSTIAALVTGQHPGYAGKIAIGGTDLQKISQRELMRNVTMVTHNNRLFKGSVRQLLQMADSAATDDAMWRALRSVRLEDFIKSQNGLDTQLLENGSNLSGGQRQRLSLAQALLADSPMYIFDEVTSNIDSDSENDIISAIWELGKTKPVLLISHRLANVVPSQNIYVMEAGQVVESGAHQELIAAGGSYAAMYNRQQELEQIQKQEKIYA